ncbi:hypothetical protein [Acaryochloris marina]|nr:hypothetical protein [Acaryochloris marina]BDM83185.1 hypothetical protein AM10699_60460 [Acaryochloris marina MBIC10699]
MQTAILRVGDASLLVTPDGKPLPHKDAEQPTFHIMPKLFNTGAGIGLENITLYGAHVLAFGKSGDDEKDYINVLPKDVRLTNPCPNIRYVIAGTADRKMGWDIPLDPSKPPQQLRLWWLLETQTDSTIIEHYIDLEFELTQRGNVFSMASLNFAVGEGPRAVSFVDPEQACEFFTRNDPAYQIGYKGADLIIRQSNKIQSCAWSDLGLEEFEEMVHLRDMTPVDTFHTHLEEFASDACIEMPPHILKQAIQDAIWTDDMQESIWNKSSGYEQSPALQRLCRWWNENAPNPEYRRAANIVLWVRVEDDSEYWAGWYECPNIDIGVLTSEMSANVGQHVIVQFLQGRDAYTPIGGYGCMIWGVDGCEYIDVGATVDEVDEAYYGHHMLKDFPDRFPVAWKCLHDLAQ